MTECHNVYAEKFAQSCIDLKIDGMRCSRLSIAYDSVDAIPPECFDILVSFTKDVAIGLFSSWLYDFIKKSGEKEPKINGQKFNECDIQNVIVNLTNNNIEKPITIIKITNNIIIKKY